VSPLRRPHGQSPHGLFGRRRPVGALRRPHGQSPHGLYGRRRPVGALELVDDRFDQLARELRAASPLASEALRARVRALGTPAPPRRPQLPLRRLVPRLALAGVAISLSVAVAVGVVHGISTRGGTQRAVSLRAQVKAPPPVVRERAPKATNQDFSATLSRGAGAVPSAPDRLHQYDAVLTLRVDDQSDLSTRTSQAMRLARALGGYVASANYDAPGERGASALVLRIPIDRVQQALEAFSAYGTIVSQRISVKDVQHRVDALASTIALLRKDVAKVEQKLAGTLGATERNALEQRLASDRHRLKALTSTTQSLTRRAQLARIVLTLVTPRSHQSAAPGRFKRTIDGAGGVLARELELLLYAVVVVGPLLAIGAAGVAAARIQRRRSDRRLLERA
jgi:Domain of unknown function (DUF4349)